MMPNFTFEQLKELYEKDLDLEEVYESLNMQMQELESQREEIKQAKQALEKARSRTIDLFGKNMDLKKAFKQIQEQKSQIETQKTEIEKKNTRLRRTYKKTRDRTIELFGKHIDLKKAQKELTNQKKRIEAQRDALEQEKQRVQKTYEKARSRTIELFGKHIDLKKAKKRIEFQQELLMKSHHELEIKNNQINDSISYAKRIQEAILPSEKLIRKQFPDSFIFFKPKDVVSGDFYWFSELKEKLFIAAVDCTGHGVPGAFMSMIGNTLLNEIVNHKKITDPSKILEELNTGIYASLNQGGDIEFSQDDGMDITLACIDKAANKVRISAASHMAYIIKDEKISMIEGDIFSIGGIFAKHPDLHFTTHTFDIKNELLVYMFSDGYQDQFGGENNTKFMAKKFKELLFSIRKLPMSEQLKKLDDEYHAWKKDNKQLDDVLVIGLKIHPFT